MGFKHGFKIKLEMGFGTKGAMRYEETQHEKTLMPENIAT